ncbi:MAG: hypothetical protein ABI769_15740 [Pseudomonadota bacterium]
MFSRSVLWGATLGFSGAVLADYSSYDISTHVMIKGAVLGVVAGIIVAFAIDYLTRSRR